MTRNNLDKKAVALTGFSGVLGVRVNLNQQGILLDEQVVHVEQHLGRLFGVVFQTDLLGDLKNKKK